MDFIPWCVTFTKWKGRTQIHLKWLIFWKNQIFLFHIINHKRNLKQFIQLNANICQYEVDTVKPLNSGHLRVLKKLTVIERCPLLGGNFKKIVMFGTQRLVRYSQHVCALGCPLLGDFTVILFYSKVWPLKKRFHYVQFS